MKIVIKRIYDEYEKDDGFRVLVDRLWPRGITKEKARVDMWAKEITPSSELRKWTHEKPEERFKDFVEKYKHELRESEHFSQFRDSINKHDKVTLLSSVKNIDNSHVTVLLKELEQH